MEEISQSRRTPALIEELVVLWEKSVEVSHLFLSTEEISEIKKYVPQALKEIKHLIIESDKKGKPIAFRGIYEQKLEMLFLNPDDMNKGLGRKLLEEAISHYLVRELTVNEQNPQARAFYEYMGFKIYKREAIDEQGQPYPILYMNLV